MGGAIVFFKKIQMLVNEELSLLPYRNKRWIEGIEIKSDYVGKQNSFSSKSPFSCEGKVLLIKITYEFTENECGFCDRL